MNLILGYSPFGCLIPIMPPGIVPLIDIEPFVFRLITGVSI